MPRCHACGVEYNATGRVGFRDACGSCNAGLHACLNCRFYDPGAAGECREEQAELVVDKDRGNRCEWFQAGSGRNEPGESADSDRARDKLDALFRKPGEPSRPGGPKKDPRAAAEDLFRKKR